jgi:hypothetical protein
MSTHDAESGVARNHRIAQHLRTQLAHRHASNPRFLEILFKLTDAHLLQMEREHHAATVAAIQAAKSRVESAKRITEARQAASEVTSTLELCVTEAMKQAVRRERARRGVKR